MRTDEEPIVVEQDFDVPVDRLWKAITDPACMREWFFRGIPEFRPDIGFTTRFDVTSQQRVFPHVWTVTEVVPLKKLAYRWQYDGYPGDSVVIFEAFQESEGSRLRVTHRVDADFPDDIPEFTRESGLAGWQYFINTSLKQFLAQ